jgi:hypothetical protein
MEPRPARAGRSTGPDLARRERALGQESLHVGGANVDLSALGQRDDRKRAKDALPVDSREAIPASELCPIEEVGDGWRVVRRCPVGAASRAS